MIQKMVSDLNAMKEKRTKLEQEMNMKINNYHDQLRRMDHDISEMNENIRLARANEKGSDRTVNWNRELEGNWKVEGQDERKLFEREYVYDSAHRK